MNPLLLLFECDKRKDQMLIDKREKDFKRKIDLINEKNYQVMSYWSNMFNKVKI